jgi:hypothetical protein
VLTTNNTKGAWYTRSGAARAWREATYLLAKAAKLPQGLDGVHIHAVFGFTNRRNRDADNLHPTLKPIVDALGPQRQRWATRNGVRRLETSLGYGLVADDTRRYVSTWIDIDGNLYKHEQVILTITEGIQLWL